MPAASRVVTAALVLTLAAGTGAVPAAGADPDPLGSVKGSCVQRDAADDDVTNGVTLPYLYCDDGVPPVGGRIPNEGAVRAVPVPQRYDGFVGLPPKTAPDPNAGADANGDIALDVNVSLPDPALHPPPRRGYPLVVFMHGCCAGNKTGWEAPTVDAPGERWHYSNAWFASRGYVVLTYTARGFVDGNGRGSTGETQLDSRRYEINDYQHLVGLLADDRFFRVDPRRVVATGGSYGGGFSWMALTDPHWTSPGGRHVRLAAVAPKYGWTDLVYPLVPNGAHLRDELPATDGSDSADPLGSPKRSIIAGLYLSGTTGIPPGSSHATFPPEIDEGFVCLNSTDPFEMNPLCARTLEETLPEFIADRSAYYQNHFFQGLADGAVHPIPVFSAGTFTDPLFTSVEHRRMVDRLRSTVPRYPVQEYYGDYQHFAQNKPKEWGDVCGADRHVCRLSDYPEGELDAEPAGLVSTGVTTMLNRFVDRFARPQANPRQAGPRFGVTASLQVCPENASPERPADEPGERFTAPTFDRLAPETLRIDAVGAQATTSVAAPNLHALSADPVANQVANGNRCPVETRPAGPGVATYDSEPLPDDFTMIGRARATVPHTGAGTGIQLHARLYDLFPDGRQVLVDRGMRILTSPDGTAVLDLNGNGWRFPAGHRIRIELAQDADPYVKASTRPSALVLGGVTLEIPVREPSATLAGGPAAPLP